MSLEAPGDDGLSSNSAPQQSTTNPDDGQVKKTMFLSVDVRQGQEKTFLQTSSRKHPTDADVLNAVCSMTDLRSLDDSTLVEPSAPEPTSSSQSKEITNSTNYTPDVTAGNCEEYWSDEEHRYPPQMSLSPVPGQSPRKMVRKEKNRKEKQHERESENVIDKRTKYSADDTERRSKLMQRRNMVILSPIATTPDTTTTKPISPVVSPHQRNQTVSPMALKTSYKREPQPETDSYISSPSLIKPVLTTSPVILNDKCLLKPTTSLLPTCTHRKKHDHFFDSQRVAIPHGRISRSISNNVNLGSSSSTMFPEITAISQSQRISKSIPDFRQSPSIFGKLVRKNSSKESVKQEKETHMTDKETSEKPSSSSAIGGSTRRKIRRILSLH